LDVAPYILVNTKYLGQPVVSRFTARDLFSKGRGNENNNSRKLKVKHTIDKIQSYQKNWPQRVKMMEHARIPMMALQYQPKGKGDIGRPKTRRSDQQHLED
jgi:hypothetical protein